MLVPFEPWRDHPLRPEPVRPLEGPATCPHAVIAIAIARHFPG